MQSDVWGFVSIQKHISHYSQGDFSVNSITINGWLRNLLWSEASQVIQSYALSSICPYGFIFLIAHFIWAFSLMFLFSGRAYWQELIESILWSHHKLKIIPHIQPRALSISQGRAVGFTADQPQNYQPVFCSYQPLSGVGITPFRGDPKG